MKTLLFMYVLLVLVGWLWPKRCASHSYKRVIAETRAVKALYPETDVIIELGGEDAKVTYLGQTAEHRMNGSCAGGTGLYRPNGDLYCRQMHLVLIN